jgi:CBS domain-containing protein
MQVSVLLQTKGTEVHAVPPDVSVADAIEVLSRHRIGAVVVSADGRSIDGILSERDIVRALADHGPSVVSQPAHAVMTTDVVTCQPDTTVEELMAVMTNRRMRHVPVLVEGELAGLVSIGDVVKDHIATLEHETRALHDYITHPY